VGGWFRFVNHRLEVRFLSPAPIFQALTAGSESVEMAGVMTVLILAAARRKSSSLTLL